MPFQTFDTEEFLANGVFSIPRGSDWTWSEGAKDRRYQVGLSAAGPRSLSRAPHLGKCEMPELQCGRTPRLPPSWNRLRAKRPRS
jgi:hypothetical protein